MHEAVQYIIGDHDFRNICKMDVANGVTNFKRTITNAKVTKVTENDEITFTGTLNFFTCLSTYAISDICS